MKARLLVTTFLLFAFGFVPATAQILYPENVEVALRQTKNNRKELEKSLDYFYKTGDSIKIKSINFLIANMPIHSSQNYYWADSNNVRIPFRELDYDSFENIVKAIDNLKIKYGKIHPVAFAYKDLDSIKAQMLIDNVELAIKAVKEKGVEFNVEAKFDNEFYEYILPYRTSVEPLENWRNTYKNKFPNLINSKNKSDSQMLCIGQNINKWFTNTYAIEKRGEPLPRLGGLQLLNRKKGACEDIAGLGAFIARSQGYAATVDFVPAWATASGVHFLNYLNIPNNSKHHYNVADGEVIDTFPREPAKVLRTTYSPQSNTIATFLNNDTSLIPMGYMRTQNYLDVTNEYWKTADLMTELFPIKNTKPAFLCAWNYLTWRPIWYGKKIDKNKITFTNMSKGVVYIPMYYDKQKMTPAGWPIIHDFDTTMLLIPDTLNKRVVIIEEQAKYLAFRAGSKYILFYWLNKWVEVGTKIADKPFTKLQYENVPSNVLLLLIPDYSKGKERVFIIDSKGNRKWY
jgi:hypothetical protein